MKVVQLGLLLGAVGFAAAAFGARPDIGVVYFPDYHPNDEWNMKNHGGAWSEWNLVKAGVPRWEGHKQPLRPVWGYTDESDPKVMERAIDAMADHGIDFVMYDWYWYDGGPFLENALNKGFLRAKNRNRLKFFVMWANHDWGLYPVHRHGAVMLRFWKPTDEQYEKACRHIIADYFSQPNYMKTAKGEPIFSIYDLWGFTCAAGGYAEGMKRLNLLRQWTKEAGYPGLHLNVHSCGVYDAGKMKINLDEAWGYDSVTTYTLTHHMKWTGRDTDYNTACDDFADRIWPDLVKKLKVPYYPTATIGWDCTARGTVTEPWGFGPYPWTGVITGSCPKNFKRTLERLKRDAEKNKTGMILINSWNEWTEGSVLEPEEEYGFGYLEAVRDVFGVKGKTK